MIRRRPDDEGGVYYRVFPEGTVEGYDGHLLTVAHPLEGLDFNRNFPSGWRPEGDQAGAGEFPGSEPEVRAVVEFLGRHPNIYGALSYHTYSRALLRPFSDQSDDEMDLTDLRVYEAIGERGTEITGYPCASTYHHFRYHPRRVITGVFDDWLYRHKGVYAYTVELWDLVTAAGIEEKNREKKFAEWFEKHPAEHDHRILDFLDAHIPEGLVAWYPFEHPQLGAVELGGWDQMFTWRNPPPALLEAEIAPQAEFALSFLALAPQLAWRAVEVHPLGGDLYHVRAVVENLGFLPTCGSSQAEKAKAARPVRVRVELPEGATLESGQRQQELGHLQGRSHRLTMDYFEPSPTDNRGKAEWVIRAASPATVTLQAASDRAGTLRTVVELGAAPGS
jgi:Zinc carboxypeptidase